MQNPRQYKIPDWFLNRQKDIKDGKTSQVSLSLTWLYLCHMDSCSRLITLCIIVHASYQLQCGYA